MNTKIEYLRQCGTFIQFVFVVFYFRSPLKVLYIENLSSADDIIFDL